MITVMTGLPQGVLGFEATGRLTAEDYTGVLEPALAAAGADGGRIRVLLEFGGEFDGMSLARPGRTCGWASASGAPGSASPW